jgi:DNA-directed RNA polymerase subunit RPC12/RpoP
MAHKELSKYKCSLCHRIFKDKWTEKERLKEMKEVWGDIPESERVIICDDCYNQIEKEEIKKIRKRYLNLKR